MGTECECRYYAFDGTPKQHEKAMLTGHHPDCKHAPDPFDVALKLIFDLVRGIDAWAADEDHTIHPKAWAAYREAKGLQGIFLPVDQTLMDLVEETPVTMKSSEIWAISEDGDGNRTRENTEKNPN
jgi:hypothetical protein